MPATEVEQVVVHHEGAVTRIRLARPEKRNALTPAMIDRLHRALTEATDRGSTVLSITGTAGVFCAGADIAGYVDAAAHTAELREFTHRARDLCTRLASSDLLTLAVVDGMALGGGMELALACDLMVCSDSSVFSLPEITLGLIPGWGGTQRLAEALGVRRAKAAILTAQRFSAADVAAYGLAHAVVPAPLLEATAEEFITEITRRAPLAVRAAIAAVSAYSDPTGGRTVGAACETAGLLALFTSADGVEGVNAFLDKRPAHFTGS